MFEGCVLHIASWSAIASHLYNFYVADIELGDGLGPHAHANLLGWRSIILDQHLPQVPVNLHAAYDEAQAALQCFPAKSYAMAYSPVL